MAFTRSGVRLPSGPPLFAPASACRRASFRWQRHYSGFRFAVAAKREDGGELETAEPFSHHYTEAKTALTAVAAARRGQGARRHLTKVFMAGSRR